MQTTGIKRDIANQVLMERLRADYSSLMSKEAADRIEALEQAALNLICQRFGISINTTEADEAFYALQRLVVPPQREDDDTP